MNCIHQYDQLQRLKNQDVYAATYNIGRPPSITSIKDYQMGLTYNPDGNITTLMRNGYSGNPGGIPMDSLNYYYYNNTNRLERIGDKIQNSGYKVDLDNKAGMSGNYQYDEVGNLVSDESEKLSNITWNIANKITSLEKTGDSSVIMTFSYDPSGNRIAKQVNNKIQVYVRDAQGNIITVYSKISLEAKHSDTTLYQDEVHLYGSSRLGVWSPHRSFAIASNKLSHFKNQRNYELTNHLGNVMVTVTDHKNGIDDDNNTLVDYYEPVIVSSQDYYPGGMLMPGRSYSSDKYRFGFNGKENDNEIKGNGNSQDYGMRIYDPRIVRFNSVDPLFKKYPELSTYQFASNSPIWAVDLDGKESYIATVDQAGMQTSMIELPQAGPLGEGVQIDQQKANGCVQSTYDGGITVHGSSGSVERNGGTSFTQCPPEDNGTFDKYTPNRMRQVTDFLSPSSNDQGFVPAAKFIGRVAWGVADDLVKVSSGLILGPSKAFDINLSGINQSEFTDAGVNTLLNFGPTRTISGAGKELKVLNAAEFSTLYKGTDYLKGGERALKMAKENGAVREVKSAAAGTGAAFQVGGSVQQADKDKK